MNTKSLYLLLILFSSIILSCSKEETPLEEEKTINNPPTAPEYYINNITECVGLKPELKWEASTDQDGDDITYTFYIGESEESLVKLESNIIRTYYTFRTTLKDNTTYLWQVVASDGESETASEIWSFKTLTKQQETVAPSIPILQAPVFDEYYIEVGYVITFSWLANSNDDSVTYSLFINPLTGNDHEAIEVTDLTTTSSQQKVSLGNWEWNVVATNEDGNSTKSTTRQLNLE